MTSKNKNCDDSHSPPSEVKSVRIVVILVQNIEMSLKTVKTPKKMIGPQEVKYPEVKISSPLTSLFQIL